MKKRLILTKPFRDNRVFKKNTLLERCVGMVAEME